MLRIQEFERGSFSKIVVGLGNPGERYSRTRHNVGFMTVDALARECAGRWVKAPYSMVCGVVIEGFSVLLAEPLTYMNQSGKAVRALLSSFRREPQDLVLIVDDLNLPFGRIRVRARGSAGGHHGLESVFGVLNTDEVIRVRMGIGEEGMPEDKAGFVLSDFPPQREAELNAMIQKAGSAVKSILRDGVSKTMAIFNA